MDREIIIAPSVLASDFSRLGDEVEQVVEAGGTWFATKGATDGPLLTMRNLNRDIVIRSTE